MIDPVDTVTQPLPIANAHTKKGIQGGAVDGWQLKVIGKGGMERFVPVSYAVVGELSHYLASRGLDRDPQALSNAGVFLLGKVTDVAERAPWSPWQWHQVNPHEGITKDVLSAQFKAFFTDCGTAMARTDPRSAQRFYDASAHWLRHTHGSHATAAGMPVEIVQKNMGHASLDTTTMYVTAEARRRMQAMATFWEAGEKRRQGQRTSGTGATGPFQRSTAAPVAQLTLWLAVENNSPFTRGKKKAREDIESWCLSDYRPTRISEREYALAMPYEAAASLDQQIDALLVEIHRAADMRNCTAECSLHDKETNHYWS